MGYMKDYDFDLAYHLSKTKVVTDALSRRSYLASMLAMREWKLLEDSSDTVFQVLR